MHSMGLKEKQGRNKINEFHRFALRYPPSGLCNI